MKLTVYNKYNLLPNIENIEENIPIFATQQYADYLKFTKNSKVLWIKGENDNGVDYLTVFSIIKKGIFRKGIFETNVISLGNKNSIVLEKEFLNKVIEHIKFNNLCDWIQQGRNWAIFNTYPDGAIYAPFGTYKINLKDTTEEDLYKNLYGRLRGKINKAKREKELVIRKGEDNFKDAIPIIDQTLREAKLYSFTSSKFNNIKKFLSDNINVYTAYFKNESQSSLITFYNSFSVYYLYGGSKKRGVNGVTELLMWELILDSKRRNIKYLDFVGARINPDENSKLYRIQRNKSHYGSELKEGFLWKITLNKNKHKVFTLYKLMQKLLMGKSNNLDIIDQEIKRLKKH